MRAPDSRTASATLSRLIPPASIQGSGQRRPDSSVHSKASALPPGSAFFMSFGGRASNISQSAASR